MSAYYQALVYTGLGDRDKAFTYLEEACEARDGWLIWLGTEPKLDDLRSDPRFDGLLKRVGLNGNETKPWAFRMISRRTFVPSSKNRITKSKSQPRKSARQRQLLSTQTPQLLKIVEEPRPG